MKRFILGLLLIFCAALPLSAQADPFVIDPDLLPGLAGAQAAGLLWPVGQTQTRGSVTMTLDWAYADLNRLAIGYTITGVSEDQIGTTITSAQRLYDDAGYFFSYASGAVVESPTGMHVAIEFYNQGVLVLPDNQVTVLDDYFRARYGESALPETISLRFAADFTLPAGSPLSLETLNPAAAFVFDFTLPLFEGIVIAPMETVEDQELAVTLETVLLAPAQITAHVCYERPDTRDWGLSAHLELNGLTVPHSASRLMPSSDPALQCRSLSFALFAEPTASASNQIALVITSLETTVPEGGAEWERIRQLLADEGISFTVVVAENGLRLDNLVVPPGVDFEAAVDRARVEMGNRIEGAWRFEIDPTGR